MNILFTVFTALTMMGLVGGEHVLDDFQVVGDFRLLGQKRYSYGGRCYNTGCTSGRTCPKFCYPFVGTLEFKVVADINGTDVGSGVEKCAKACANYGKKEGLPENKAEWSRMDEYQGEFVCNSFDYRPMQENNCLLHQNPSKGTQGARPGSTRSDFTGYYCYSRISTQENSIGGLPCNTVPPTVEPTPSPTVEPTPCQDDEGWTYINDDGKTRDCTYVAKNTDKRCKKAGATKLAGSAQACCACKTVEPTPCQDDEGWTYKNDDGKTRDCTYVAKNTDNRCKKAGAPKFAGSAQACCACKN